MGPKMIQLLKTDGAIYYCQKKKKNQQLILLNQYEWGQQDSTRPNKGNKWMLHKNIPHNQKKLIMHTHSCTPTHTI